MSMVAGGRIELREDELRWLVVVDGWSAALRELVNSGQVDGIELNSTKGAWGGDLGFLCEVPELKHLMLISFTTEDVRPLERLTELETLDLNTYATGPLDFSRFPKLKQLFVEWRKQYRNLSSCANLADLYLNRYTETKLLVVAAMPKMHTLRVGDSRPLTSLEGIGDLAKLRMLGLYGLPKLTSLEPIQNFAATLEELELYQCRYLKSIEPLAAVQSLKRLLLIDCGNIPSLRSVEHCRKLEELLFYGDTNIVDGNLEFLRTMPLKNVAFQNWRHYSVRNEELPGWHR